MIDFDVNDGDSKHMQFDYDDSFGEHFSEVRFDANDGSASGSDWTGGGALPADNKCRSSGNRLTSAMSTTMPTRIMTGCTRRLKIPPVILGWYCNSDSQAQRAFGWTQWYIDLNDFNDTTPA